jgi:hypothetical protein
VFSDKELFHFLPSKRTQLLAAAIGRQLLDVERLFFSDLETFLRNGRFSAADFFARNSGPVQFHFDGTLSHALGVWPSQLSVVVLPSPLSAYNDDPPYLLSEDAHAAPELKACLGRTCEDVRIWTLREEFESEEAKEVAVSYVFEGGFELFYCIYLHGDMDSDYLLRGVELPRERANSCISLVQGGIVEPG